MLYLDTRQRLVRVQSGVRIGELGAWLAERGWRLPTAGTNASSTVGGACATGVHGTGENWGSLSDAVHGLVLIRPDGKRVEMGPDHPDLPAARLSLGALGLITELVLEVEPGANYAIEVSSVSLDQALDPTWRAEADHVDLWWLPTQTQVMAARRTQSDAPLTIHSGMRARLRRRVLEDLSLNVVAWAVQRWPQRTVELLGSLTSGPKRSHTQVIRWDHGQLGTRRFRAASMEVAVPMTAAREALQVVRDVAQHIAKTIPFHIPINLRITGPDHNTWLSPTAGRTSLWIDMAWACAVPGAQQALRQLEGPLLQLGGRPHWGKLAFANPRAAYPNFKRWAKVRERYDPEGRLLNDHLRRLLSGAPLLDGAEG